MVPLERRRTYDLPGATMNLPQYLAEIRERLDKASPGPWECYSCKDSPIIDISAFDEKVQTHLEVCSVPRDETFNALLISHLPTDLATLVRIVEIQSKALEKYEPYCVPMWVDVSPGFQETREVWLAKEAQAAVAEILK